MPDTNDNWDKLFEQLPLDATSDEDRRLELRARVLEQFDGHCPSLVAKSRLNQIRSTLMKYKVPHWTAAAALIICAAWISQSYSPAVAAEDVVAHIMKARTAQWDMIIKNEGSADVKIRVYLAPGRMRQEFETGMVVVVDWNKGQSVGLFADGKLATRKSEVKKPGSGMQYNEFEKIRKQLREAMANADRNVEKLGEQDFDGRTLVGFRFKPQSRLITIWADPETAFPVRIETDIPQKTRLVMMNYKFNIEMDPSLFSLEIPEGYSLKDETSPIPLIDVQDLIESLRMYCDSSGGEFPDVLNADTTTKASSRYARYLLERSDDAQVQRSQDELAQELLRLQRGFIFASALVADEKWDAHYAGTGVKLGAANRPILWYKLGSSNMYRVIYADLSFRDAAAAPDVADPDEAPKRIAVPGK